jgi:hypothetical protein
MFDFLLKPDTNTVKIQMDSDIKAVLNKVMQTTGAKDYQEAARYAILHAKTQPQAKAQPASGEPTKRASKEERNLALMATLERIIKDNQTSGQAVLMRITGAERALLGVAELPVKHWQRAITERAIRDGAGVSQKIAAEFVIKHKSQIDRHNDWLFANCGWKPADAHAFNRRTMAAARKAEQLNLGA